MRSFKGHVRKMLRHTEASSIVEYAYNDRAVLEQRNMLTEELYGNTFQLYKVTFQCPGLRMFYFCFVWSIKRLSYPSFSWIILSLVQ